MASVVFQLDFASLHEDDWRGGGPLKTYQYKFAYSSNRICTWLLLFVIHVQWLSVKGSDWDVTSGQHL